MRTTTVKKEILVHLEKMPEPLQRQVLGYIHRLESKTTRGEPGRNILGFAGAIPTDDLKSMAEAIENGCEKVDADEW